MMDRAQKHTITLMCECGKSSRTYGVVLYIHCNSDEKEMCGV